MSMTVAANELVARGVYTRRGRQFHNTESNYSLPNDEGEHERLNNQHEAIEVAAGGNYLAPLGKMNKGTGPHKILDVGTGSGRWVFDMAAEFPRAMVVGFDLSRPALTMPQFLSNVSFTVGDLKKGLPFETSSFDVVQMRMLPSVQDRSAINKEIYRVLQPDGFILLVEPGEHISKLGPDLPPELLKLVSIQTMTPHFEELRSTGPDPVTTGSLEDAWSMAPKIGPSVRCFPEMWTNVHEWKINIPAGDWADDEDGRKAGKLLQHCLPGTFRALRSAMIDASNLSVEQIDELLDRLDIIFGPEAKKWQIFYPFCFVWANKI